jgi:hypothetical protein
VTGHNRIRLVAHAIRTSLETFYLVKTKITRLIFSSSPEKQEQRGDGFLFIFNRNFFREQQ